VGFDVALISRSQARADVRNPPTLAAALEAAAGTLDTIEMLQYSAPMDLTFAARAADEARRTS
jgi:hypothetical protein